jgi:hypothetical protein
MTDIISRYPSVGCCTGCANDNSKWLNFGGGTSGLPSLFIPATLYADVYGVAPQTPMQDTDPNRCINGTDICADSMGTYVLTWNPDAYLWEGQKNCQCVSFTDQGQDYYENETLWIQVRINYMSYIPLYTIFNVSIYMDNGGPAGEYYSKPYNSWYQIYYGGMECFPDQFPGGSGGYCTAAWQSILIYGVE